MGRTFVGKALSRIFQGLGLACDLYGLIEEEFGSKPSCNGNHDFVIKYLRNAWGERGYVSVCSECGTKERID